MVSITKKKVVRKSSRIISHYGFGWFWIRHSGSLVTHYDANINTTVYKYARGVV